MTIRIATLADAEAITAIVGVYRKVGFKLGAWHDVGWLQKELRSPAEPTDPTTFGGRAAP